MDNSFIPRKLAIIRYNPKSMETLSSWLIHFAKRSKVIQGTGISKATLFRRISTLKSNELNIIEVFSFDQINKLISLENQDWKESKEDNSNYKNKTVKLRKLALVKIKKDNIDFLETWLLDPANKKQVAETLGISRNNLYLIIDKLKNDQKQITEFFTIPQLQILIDLENVMWDNFKHPKSKKKISIVKKIQNEENKLKAALKSEGWNISSTNLDFAKVLRLQKGDIDQQSKANTIIKHWSKEKQLQYFKYKREITI